MFSLKHEVVLEDETATEDQASKSEWGTARFPVCRRNHVISVILPHSLLLHFCSFSHERWKNYCFVCLFVLLESKHAVGLS